MHWPRVVFLGRQAGDETTLLNCRAAAVPADERVIDQITCEEVFALAGAAE